MVNFVGPYDNWPFDFPADMPAAASAPSALVPQGPQPSTTVHHTDVPAEPAAPTTSDVPALPLLPTILRQRKRYILFRRPSRTLDTRWKCKEPFRHPRSPRSKPCPGTSHPAPRKRCRDPPQCPRSSTDRSSDVTHTDAVDAAEPEPACRGQPTAPRFRGTLDRPPELAPYATS